MQDRPVVAEGPVDTRKSKFDDGKEPGALRTIGEVSSGLGIKPHVLRYWEQQFPMLQPLKRSGNRRYYRADDIALIELIDRLVNRQGYTLRGARKAIESGEGQASEQPDPGRPAAAPHAAQNAAATGVGAVEMEQLRAIRDRLAGALEDAA